MFLCITLRGFGKSKTSKKKKVQCCTRVQVWSEKILAFFFFYLELGLRWLFCFVLFCFFPFFNLGATLLFEWNKNYVFRFALWIGFVPTVPTPNCSAFIHTSVKCCLRPFIFSSLLQIMASSAYSKVWLFVQLSMRFYSGLFLINPCISHATFELPYRTTDLRRWC